MIPNTFHQELSDIDKMVSDLSPEELQHALERIPLDIFGRIQIDRPSQYPQLMKWLPEMPAPDVQITWTGSSDHTLMTMSLAFIKTVISTYREITSKPLRESSILDFGCGWGRMVRLFSKYVPTNNIYCVDPWDRSIEICKKTGVNAHLFVSDYLPRTLPTPEGKKFDFIFAFSVFTHLSERATKLCAATLADYLTDDGVLAITIRPEEYWDFRLRNEPHIATKKETQEFIRQHQQEGFAFFPHGREKIEGDVTYGDTSMTLDFIRSNFTGLKIERVDLNEQDVYQLVVFLKKKPL